ncbi:MAG: pyridoxamine 5'-phosphate oxidase [Alphaproteobacteria bacterium]|jgi:pyridoxamine 5'-phosphate oxidase|nr:pyridoxamine 5'-phosphate oxidase [Alphaproteobacteria bacterium]
MFEPDTNDPFALFKSWFADAEASETSDPNAMTVATADAIGRPSARILLLKGVDDRGFVFYSNFESRKGAELAVNPFAALCFHWKSLKRQVRVEGPIVTVDDAEADAYFASRARMSQTGAWASQQSRPLASRDALIASVRKYEEEYADRDIPRPPYWTGARVIPLRIEFWHDGEFRLHDRFVFARGSEGQDWTVTRLNP